ncbi:MAG: glycosyltransferase family 4 protein, partial [Thermodesulfobacteriota bacterium]|nr:glycosyltransferase family 4 protein [Thermodesulfobacteriota bacterium]
MKIALIRKDYLHSGGGAERYVYNLSHEFAKNGQEVHIFANRWEDPQEQSIKIHPVPLIKINSPIKNLSFAFNLRKELSVKNFDIVHSFSHVYPSDIYRMGDGIHRIWLKIETPSTYLRFFKYINPRHLAILFLE